MAGGESRTLWIIANWKSHKTIQDGIEWVNQVGPQLPQKERLKIVVCPTFVAVEEIKKAVMVGGYPMLVGVQDLSPFEEGAYTGEEAASLMKDFVDLAILGHSERRKNFGETDQIVGEKVEMAKKHSIIPVVCIENEQMVVPNGVSVVAYEPTFAIGTGTPDTPAHAKEMAEKIRQSHGSYLEILYGGSVDSENAKDFLSEEQLNGLLIGTSSLDSEEFVKIVNLAANYV